MSLNHIKANGITIKIGEIIPMYIKEVNEKGVNAVYGVYEAFISITDLRYGFIKDIFTEFQVGKQIFVKVLGIEDDDNKKIKVSGKQAQINPWGELGIVHQMKVGDIWTGEVTGVKEYGLFINLIDGVDALVRPMSKRAYNYEPVHVGDKVDVKISEIDINKKQIKGKLRWVEKKIRIRY